MPRKKQRVRVYYPETAFDDLTPTQKSMVKWMHCNDGSPWDAVRAGICSKASVELWRVTNCQAWLKNYRDALPPTPTELADQARNGINGLLGNALRVVSDTLINGQGDATAVKTAKWVVDGVLAQAAAIEAVQPRPGMEPQDPEAELKAVLSIVTG
jgi:hypothetical protein